MKETDGRVEYQKCPDDRALVDPGVPSDERFVLDDDRQRPNRLDDAADLRSGAHVDAGADLRQSPNRREAKPRVASRHDCGTTG